MAVFAVANTTGAIIVNTYLSMTGQESVADIQEDLHSGSMLLGTYFLVSGVACAFVGIRWLSVLRSIDAGQSTDAERRDTLLLPRRFALLTIAVWTVGAILFAISGHLAGDDGRHVLRSFTGSLLGGLTTSAMCYLLVERALRSTFARVLAVGAPSVATVGVRARVALAWWLGSGVPLLGVALSPLFPNQTTSDLAALGGIGIISGVTLIAVASHSISDRLASVRAALAQIQAGDLAVEVEVDEAGEIGQLQAGVNEMVRGLRERTVIADLFGRHVGAEVARQALKGGVHLGGEQRDVSVLFLDVTGSTFLAATRPATEVVAWLNELFTIVVRVVGEEGGWVDKFEGDAALCAFGAPAPLDDHPTHALRAARRLRDVVVPLSFGIGVSSGLVVAGNIGSESRFEYTVIGDPVNEASRLTEAAKQRPSGVLAACRTYDRADPDETRHWALAETLALRGRPEPTPTCEPRSTSLDAHLDRTKRSATGE
jgi:adenylate cyclase